MHTSRTIIRTPNALRYAAILSHFFSENTNTEGTTQIQFPHGVLAVTADSDQLRLEVLAETKEALDYIEGEVSGRLRLEEVLEIVWERPVPVQPDWEEVGRQLGKPTGDAGRRTGVAMNHANFGMIRRGFELLNPVGGVHLLEIGPGNGAHLREVMSVWPNFSYIGVDISDTMLQEAFNYCRGMNNVSFLLTDGASLPFANESFDRILTVNTIYFWEDPFGYTREIYRVLKTGSGLFCLVFVEESFMRQLPFTSKGFELYSPSKAWELLRRAGFRVLNTIREPEEIKSNSGENVTRERVLILATK